MATYLDRILDAHRAAAVADERDLGTLVAEARATKPGRPFAQAIRARAGLSVIAEVKRASPSKGVLAPDLDPVALARSYEAGGAAGLSVLTDREFFQGSPEDLAAARAATVLPVLRKDFTIGGADVCDARLMGADAVLLIAAALSPGLLPELITLAAEVGIDALVEVHDEDELERAIGAGATLVGVNQRDLVTFQVDTARAERLAKVIPEAAVSVAESGIRSADDAARLADAGFDAVLVGESLVTSTDPAVAVAALKGNPLIVKICGTTSEDDALLAVAMGADMVGFVFATSPRQIAPQQAADIVKRLPREIVSIGVFRNESPQRVVQIAQSSGMGGVQLSGHETAEQTEWIRKRMPFVIKGFSAGDDRIANAAAYGADVILLDAPHPGSGQVFDWALSSAAPQSVPLMIAGGLNPDNVAAAIASTHAWGVDVVTGVERAPGVKDPLKLRAFIANAKAADPADEARRPAPVPAGPEDPTRPAVDLAAEGAPGVYNWEDE